MNNVVDHPARRLGKSELAISTIQLCLALHKTMFLACANDRRGWWKQIVEEKFPDAKVTIDINGVIIKCK